MLLIQQSRFTFIISNDFFLSQVIEYIQALQEKVQKYESPYSGWNQDNVKLMPWVIFPQPKHIRIAVCASYIIYIWHDHLSMRMVLSYYVKSFVHLILRDPL